MLPIGTIVSIISALDTALPMIESIATNALPIIDQAAKALEAAVPGTAVADFAAKVDELDQKFQAFQSGLGHLGPFGDAIKALEGALAKHTGA